MPTVRSRGRAALVAGILIACCISDAVGRVLTVRDSIEMTRLVDPDGASVQGNPSAFKWSPDGARFFLVLRRGNLQSGDNEYSLVLFEGKAVLDFVAARDRRSRPQPRYLATFRTATPRHAISSARWVDGGAAIALIGKEGEARAQVFVVDVVTRTARRVSNHDQDIVEFDMSSTDGTLVYWANAYPDWSERNRHGYAIGSESAAHLGMKDPTEAEPEVELFVVDMSTAARRKVELHRGLLPHPISIAPDGRTAIVAATLRRVPVAWSEYDIIKGNPTLRMPSQLPARSSRPDGNSKGTALFLEADDAFGQPAGWINRYEVIDLQIASASPLLDAPAALAGRLDSAIWSPDGHRALVPATYLPLSTDQCTERTNVDRTQFVVEIEASTRAIRCISEVADHGKSGGRLVLVGARWLTDEAVEVEYSELDGWSRARHYYVLTRGRWQEVRELPLQSARTTPRDRLELTIQQDMNSAPEISARDRKTARTARITQLNPQFADIALGRVEQFSWNDALGRRFTGGLLFPPGQGRGSRYPIVFQTYGFKPGEFLIDGPLGITTAYAARALAGRGMLVLQMPRLHLRLSETKAPHETAAENSLFLAGLEGAVKALDDAALADTRRMGLIGFSREGMHVHHALVFSSHRFAAATVADSIGATPFCYSLAYGLSYPGMHTFEDEDRVGMGGPFWGDSVGLWVQRSYIFHLHRIAAAVRYEQTGAYGTSCHWDAFAFQKRARRPVEMIHIPLDEHNLQTPFGRYTSQEGNVDWFDFWLQSNEDPTPAKEEQYVRWRRLRSAMQQDVSTNPHVQ